MAKEVQRIVIAVPLWKRSTLWRYCAERLSQTIQQLPQYQFAVVCAVSKEDPHMERNVETCRKHRYDVIFVENKPVGKKMNTLMQYCFEVHRADYVMNMGSDNIVSPDLFNIYEKHIRAEMPIIGINLMWFIADNDRSTATLRLTNQIWGAGRLIHRWVWSKLQDKHWPMYDDLCERGLDGNSISRIQHFTGATFQAIIPQDFPYIVDVKNASNINSFQSVIQNGAKIRTADSYSDFVKTYLDLIKQNCCK